MKRDVSVIALAETFRVKSVHMEAGIYNSKGNLKYFLVSTINKNIILKERGTDRPILSVQNISSS